MKIAIVTDTVPTFNEPLWSDDWKRLCAEHCIEHQEFDSYLYDFMEKLVAYRPDRVLWRSSNSAPIKFKDEIQRQILDKEGLRVVPSWRTHYIYDHKIRQSYLFKLNYIPHPETRVFFKESHALTFVEKAEYPFVVKADSGAGAKSFKFVEDKKQAREIVNSAFHKKGTWAGREYEKHIFYVQEYIPITGSWRVGVFKEEVAYGYLAAVNPKNRKASGQGLRTYPTIPQEAFQLANNTNLRFNWDWGFYDIIWSEKYAKYLVLEVCDTVGRHAAGGRKVTYYREDREWVPRKETPLIPEIIFKLFVLDDLEVSESAEASGC